MISTAAELPAPEPLASLCKAMGDPMRVEILRVLAANSYGVLELADIFAVAQPRISHHLKVLAAAGLVSTRREGNSIFYKRPQLAHDDPLAEFKRSAFTSIDHCTVSAAVQMQLEKVHQARAMASHNFFIENAEKFRAQQDLIASYPVYAPAVIELLDNIALPHRDWALELGPGEGEFLPELARRFGSVKALDSSELMLRRAQAHCELQKNLEFYLGDTSSLTEQGRYSCVVVNMVLHHTPSPLQIFKDLWPTLTPGGALLVTELCLHDQTWARQACGDIWLGFDPNDINDWAIEAGFALNQSQYLALRNGFQIQLKQFIKPQ